MTSASGLLVVDKPAGMTSHSVVATARRVLRTRKIGHAGTLDPMATGVLILGVNSATRLLGYLALHDKAYAATIRLGASTVTDDAEGDVIATADRGRVLAVSDSAIESEVAKLRGELLQVPTAISAIKVDGKRSYARVRAGEQVELKARPVTVSRFDVLEVRRDDSGIEVDVLVECSTGTYVRALARDVGASLGIGGYLTVLRRTRVGAFSESEAIGLEELAALEDPAARLVSMADAARSAFPVVVADPERAEWVRNGRPYPEGILETVAVIDQEGGLVAIVEPTADGARYAAVFGPN